MEFLKLIRFPNLVMIVLSQFFIRFFLFEKFELQLALTNFEFALLIVATVFLAAGGNIINDIYDVEIDEINKPSKVVIGRSIPEKTALIFYFFLNLIAVLIGFYLSQANERPNFAVLFIVISGLLYIYASNLKGLPVIGNLLVSFLTAMVFLVVGIFDLLPALSFFNFENRQAFTVLVHFSIFAFLINLLREMVKDQEDVNGDYKAGMQTLPILLGRKRTNNIILTCTIIPAIGIFLYMYLFLYKNNIAVLYTLFFILAPLLFFIVKIIEAKKKYQFKKLSNLLKIIMLMGVLAIALYPDNL